MLKSVKKCSRFHFHLHSLVQRAVNNSKEKEIPIKSNWNVFDLAKVDIFIVTRY